MKSRRFLVFVLFLSMFFLSQNAFSQLPSDSGYDKYTQTLREGSYIQEKYGLLESIGNIPVVPLALGKNGIEKALIVIEKKHIDKKVKFYWDKLHEWGIYPTGQQLHDRPSLGYQVLVDKHDLIKNPGLFEQAGFKAWTSMNLWQYQEQAGRLNVDDIARTGIYINQLFKYEKRTREDFFGVGNKTSRGQSNTYKLEAMNFDTRWGRDFKLPCGVLNLEGEFLYRDVRIFGGKDGAKHNIRERFRESSLAGVTGGDYYGVGFNLKHDDRDDSDDPHHGGYRKFSMLYHEGINGAQFEFIKYRFEAAQFFPVWNTGNVFTFRFAAETNDKINHGTLPFFEMARLGGFNSLRGYQYNRFFDNSSIWTSFEYRYNIWTFKQYKLDLAPFLDVGSVFGESDELARARFSYGGALRFRSKNVVKIDLEMGRSSEGTQFYIKYAVPF